KHYQQNNPILSDEFVVWAEADISLNKLSKQPSIISLPTLSSIANLPLTSFALDLSDFLVQRTKEELNITFFYRLYEFLNRDENAPARILFPKTFQDLQLLQNQIFDLQSYLEGLQVSFQRDLASLPENLVSMLQLLDAAQDSKLNSQLDLLNAFISVGDGIVRKKFAPVEIIHSLAEFDFKLENQERLREFMGSIRFMDRIIYGGFWNYADSSFLDFEQSISQLENDRISKIFLGFLFEQSREIEIQKGKSLGTIFTENLESYLNIQDQLLQMGSRINQIQNDYELWEALSPSEKNNPSTYLSYTQRATSNFNGLFSVTEQVFQLVEIADTALIKIAEWNGILSSFGDLIVDVNTENYSHAIMAAVRWLEPVLEEKLTSRILFFGSFIAAVVEASEPEQLAALIETYALPPGSASMKKHSDWSLSLNSYVGFFFGLEKLETDSERAGVYGVNAPVGLALNKGFKQGGSFSIYGSIIDLGGIVAYRYNDENTSDLPEITLANLFAPGIYGVYGFGQNIPLSVGAGYQWGPQIRGVNVENQGNTTLELVESQGRINVFLGLDLSLIHLWNRPFSGQRP
ncbi:MAG: hypothetical protein MRZ79_09150, partial [Bacteroidia bacterium]|nr:hypothetical protein [Bacteroidia bacterium]